jgi:hypothetical protein
MSEGSYEFNDGPGAVASDDQLRAAALELHRRSPFWLVAGGHPDGMTEVLMSGAWYDELDEADAKALALEFLESVVRAIGDAAQELRS